MPLCEVCREHAAKEEPDPRLPRLQVLACDVCRDGIARTVGWEPVRNSRNGQVLFGVWHESKSRKWERDGEVVTVERMSS